MPRPQSEHSAKYIRKIARMKPGASFFIEGVVPADVEFLRPMCKRQDIKISIRRTESDSIYGSAGVRIWRKESEYDEL